MTLIMSSDEYRDKKIESQYLKILFWQGENPLGGTRDDICETVREYYAQEYIDNLKRASTDLTVRFNLIDVLEKLISIIKRMLQP